MLTLVRLATYNFHRTYFGPVERHLISIVIKNISAQFVIDLVLSVYYLRISTAGWKWCFFSETETKKRHERIDTNVLYLLSKIPYKNINIYKRHGAFI
jgi:hypothetical protein